MVGRLSQLLICLLHPISAGFTANHNAFAQGENNLWALANTPYSWGHYKRQDIPTQFAIAEGWTVADMYSQSVVASTNPNRRK